jgi:hypothetical protein
VLEHLTSLVSSRGLLRSCRSHNRKPVSSCDHIDEDLLRNHRAHGTIYICQDAVPRFARDFLPKITEPFTLVSGDSDYRPKLLDVIHILGNPLCEAWFMQNITLWDSKLHAMPIGMDYHTVAEKTGLWDLKPYTALEQEQQLLRIEQPQARYLAAYCNFVGDRGDRAECLAQVNPSILFKESARLPRPATWARMAQFMFVLSPSGLSPDCHRTWEALALGCVPIVKRSAITEALFATLPVLQVESWSDVRPEVLSAWKPPAINRAPMFLAQWVRRFQGLEFEQLV